MYFITPRNFFSATLFVAVQWHNRNLVVSSGGHYHIWEPLYLVDGSTKLVGAKTSLVEDV